MFAYSRLTIMVGSLLALEVNATPVADGDINVSRVEENNHQVNIRHAEQTHRYFVQFQSPSLQQSLSRIQTSVSQSRQSRSSNKTSYRVDLKAAYSNYAQSLRQQQTSVLNSVQIGGVKLPAKRQHTQLFNAAVIETSEKQAKLLQAHPLVRSVERSTKVKAYLEESVNLVSAPSAWTKTGYNGQSLTGKGITVAILDSGVDYTHPDLGGCIGYGCKVIGGYDFINNDSDPMDKHSHGTHVAGIVAANGVVTGVAPDANLLAVKVLNDQGSGWNDQIIAGIEYALDPDGDPTTNDQVDVINLSLGGPGDANSALSLAVDKAVEAGVVVVVAAGNSGGYSDVYNASPAAAKKALSVGSTTKKDELSYFSSKGRSDVVSAIKPEIVAPGSDIKSTLPNAQYGAQSGTSMAAPHVAGAAALLKQKFPNFSNKQIVAKLISGTKELLDSDPFSKGRGRLDIVNAMDQELIIHQAGLDFGSHEINRDIQSTRTLVLEIENLADRAKSVKVSLPDNLPKQARVASSSKKLWIPARSKKALRLSLSLEDTASIPQIDNNPIAFYGNVSLSDGKRIHKVPLAFNLRHTLTAKVSNAFGVEVSVYNKKTRSIAFRKWISSEAGLNHRDIKLPAGSFDIVAIYNLNPSLEKRLPKAPENVSLYLDGLETFTVELDGNLDLAFNGNNLNAVYGPKQIPSSGARASNSIEQRHAALINVFDQKSYPNNMTDNLIMTPPLNGFRYLKVGQLSDSVKTTFRQIYQQTGDVKAYIDNVEHITSRNAKDTMPDLDMRYKSAMLNVKKGSDSEFKGASFLLETSDEFDPAGRYHGADVYAIPASGGQMQYHNLGNAGSKVKLYRHNESKILNQSASVFFDKQGYDNHKPNEKMFVNGYKTYEFGYSPLFNTSIVSVSKYGQSNDMFIGLVSYELGLFTQVDGADTRLFADRPEDSQVKFYVGCNGVSELQGPLDKQYLQLKTCDYNREVKLETTREWRSQLSKSEIKIKFNPASYDFVRMRGLSKFDIVQNGRKILDNVIQLADTHFAFEVAFHTAYDNFETFDNFALEVKSASGQWKKVRATLVGKEYKVTLPRHYLSRGFASLRISYQTETNTVTQTLDNFLYVQ